MFENQDSAPVKNPENFKSTPALAGLLTDSHSRTDSRRPNSGDQPSCLPTLKLVGEAGGAIPASNSRSGDAPAEQRSAPPKPGPVDRTGDALPPIVRPVLDLRDRYAEAKESPQKPYDTKPEAKVDEARVLEETNKKLATELAKSKDFFTADEKQHIEDVLKGKKDVTAEDEANLLMNRIRKQFEKAAKMGIPSEKVVEQMNKQLKAEGADFKLEIEEKNDKWFKLSMKDNKTGKTNSTDGIYNCILVTTDKK